MNDPLRDPRFPNRPQHPDFWRLSEAAMMLDGRTAEDGQTTGQATADLIDLPSLEYACTQRTDLMLEGIGWKDAPDSLRNIVVAAMLGGVVQGIAFEKAGGHQ